MGTVARMAMNCKPVPTLDERINDIRMRTAEIVNTDIIPNEGRATVDVDVVNRGDRPV